jgi:hypothetical protein
MAYAFCGKLSATRSSAIRTFGNSAGREVKDNSVFGAFSDLETVGSLFRVGEFVLRHALRKTV